MIRITDYEKLKDATLYLLNPSGAYIGVIKAQNISLKTEVSALASLEFDVLKVYDEEVYANLQTKKYVEIADLGYFIINKVSEDSDGITESKHVSAESCEAELKPMEFAVEERVYMFYNPYDPMDEEYNKRVKDGTSTKADIPSIVGQLCSQLGIELQLDVPVGEEEGKDKIVYKNWTITSIDKGLYFNAISKNEMYKTQDSEKAICRLLSKNETFGYDFIINEVQKKFGVLFDFDCRRRAIKIGFEDSFVNKTDYYLSFDNMVKQLQSEEKGDEVTTVLNCTGGNGLEIRTVNPMGTNYIVDFDYYMNNKWMSQELIDVLTDWKEHYENVCKKEGAGSYTSLIQELQNKYLEILKPTNKKTEIGVRIQDLKNALFEYNKLRNDKINTEGDVDLKNGGIISVEEVSEGEQSLEESSRWFGTSFSSAYKSKFTKYATAPDNISEDNGFSYTEDGTSTTFSEEIAKIGHKANPQQLDEIEGLNLYFIDDTLKNSYNKLNIGVEVKLLKNSNDDFIKPNEDGFAGTVEFGDTILTISKSGDKISIIIKETEVVNIVTNNTNSLFTDGGNRYIIRYELGKFVSVERYYFRGFTRTALAKNITLWVNAWEKQLKTIETELEALEEEVAKIQNQLDVIANGNDEVEPANVDVYVKKHAIEKNTPQLYREFKKYWLQSNFESESISLVDGENLENKIGLAKQLMDAGKKELERLSVPPHSFTISSFPIPLFSLITLEPDEKAILTSVEVKFDNPTDVTLGFTNALISPLSIADLLKDAASTSRKVSANWSELIDYSANKDEIYDLLINPLDATLRAAKSNMAGQDFLISESGILGRKKEIVLDKGEVFADEQMILQNNCLLFTNDGWQTLKTALGKVVVGEENEKPVTAYGLVADVIVGNLLVGQNLAIKNEDSSVLIDGNGIEIKNGKDTVFKADMNGNALLKGEIKATSGNIGGFLIEDNVLKNKDNTLGLSGSGDYLIWAGAEKIDGTGENITPKYDTAKFSVTKDGKVKAIDGEFEGKVTATSGTFTGTVFANSGEFTGTVNATSGSFKGTIEADNGKIGGLLIEKTEVSQGGLILEYQSLKANNFELITEEGKTSLRFLQTTSGQSKIQTVSISDDGIIADSFKVSNSAFIDKSGLKTPKLIIEGGTGEGAEGGSITLSGKSISGQSSAFYFDQGGETYKYLATPSFSGVNIYVNVELLGITIGSQTNKPTEEQKKIGLLYDKTFTIKYNVIGGTSEGTTYITVKKGQRQGTVSVSAFFGVSYAHILSNGQQVTSVAVWQTTPTGQIRVQGDLIPASDRQYTLGQDGCVWADIYGTNQQVSVSDKNEKNSISKISDKYVKLFDLLTPVTYKFNDNTSGRTHIGFIAQDVKEAIKSVGLTTQEFAGYCEWKGKDETVSSGLRYGEFIALNTLKIQQLEQRIKEIEDKI